jgi:hypothetical protein
VSWRSLKGTLLRWQIPICFLLVGVAANGCAAQAPHPLPLQGADFQSWDELDASIRLTESVDVTLAAQGRFSSELSNPAKYKLGSDWNFRIAKFLVVTASYYYFAFHTATGASGHGQVPIMAVTAVFERGRFTFSDRNRFLGEVGVTGTAPFWVYRNRPRIDYRVGPSKWKTSVFTWDEVFHYSTRDGVTRNRFAVGGRKLLNDRVAASLYYQRQDDSHSTPAHIITLGTLLELRLR